MKTAAENKNFKNLTLDQTLKQIYLSEVKGKLQYNFSMVQLEKLEEVNPNMIGKCKW